VSDIGDIKAFASFTFHILSSRLFSFMESLLYSRIVHANLQFIGSFQADSLYNIFETPGISAK
jgi:hypothetical protein